MRLFWIRHKDIPIPIERYLLVNRMPIPITVAAPLSEIGAIGSKLLDSMIRPVHHIDITVLIHGDTFWPIELSVLTAIATPFCKVTAGSLNFWMRSLPVSAT